MTQSQETQEKKFPVWKTINLGTHKTGTELLAAIEKMRDEYGDLVLDSGERESYALVRDLSSRIPVAASPTSVELVEASVMDLGLPDWTCLADLDAAARRYGLCRCLPEVPFQVLSQTRQEYHEACDMIVSPFDGAQTNYLVSVAGSDTQLIHVHTVSLETKHNFKHTIFLWQRAQN